ncbi:hypothetical protein H4S04_005975 [Coemansia sp. S16]|nr:hypothetical protein H4S04_005975 [Coemansia sp. S16]
MDTYSTTSKVDLKSGPTSGAAAVAPDYSVLAGENFCFSVTPGLRDDNLNLLIQLVDNIANDLETRLLTAAMRRVQLGDSQEKEKGDDPLDAWATDILAWAGVPAPAKSVDSQPSDDSEYSDNSEPTVWEADKIALCYESFMLFVAHHVKEYFGDGTLNRGFKPEECRLILPVNRGVEAELPDVNSSDDIDPTDFATVECGICPIFSSVEKQAALAPHLFVANTEIARDQDDRSMTERVLAAKMQDLFFDQHNRRFAWGLVTTSRSIYAYVFGPDDIWASTAMDIFSAEGRLAFILLLVDWSLCSVDRLGFDPSIRYIVDRGSGGPYLEIDVHEVDESTGRVDRRMYFSQRCVGAADGLFGRHARYFAASGSPESMDKPGFLIKDVWTTTDSGSADDARERSFLDVLHAEFDKSNEFSGRFSRLVSAGPVCIRRGGTTFVIDSTNAAFEALPYASQARQHTRRVTHWVGNMISEADNQSQVAAAVADAMTALVAAYSKCRILHGNISGQAILIQLTADGVKGVLAEFDYACYFGDLETETLELMIFQSILSLEGVRPIRSHLDDLESLLYLVCWLGTFGVNKKERKEYAARYAAERKKILPIMYWNLGTAAECADHKRNHMDTALDFETNILSNMRDGPLRDLARDMHKALFLHPACSGAKKTAY